MSNPVLGNLTTSVTNTVGVMKSAEAALNGVSQKIKDAVAQALLNGATADELLPLNDLVTELDAEAANLAAAVAANP